jgi:hypothetical protein
MSEKEQADSSAVQDELLQEMFDKYLEE